jgi:ferric-dicitrate binding protein FerR (iron transport regulator)
VAIISVFTFITVNGWIKSRQEEREAFYRAETLRRITESSSEGAKEAIELMKAQNRQELLKKREGMKIGGLVCVAVGAAMVIFMRQLMGSDPGVPYLVGLIPGFVGVALLVYVMVLAGPVE